MGRIFISHSSRDNAAATAMRDWLASEGWQDVFLDLDPALGLAPGQRWREELRRAGEQCSAVIVLVSPEWAASKWCLTEFLFAAQLGKEIFPILIAPCPIEALPVELIATYQIADISTSERSAEGHERLRLGLQRAGLHPGAFAWPPKGDPHRPVFPGLRAMEEVDAAIFFGRDTQITKAMDAIRRLRDGEPERMLVILGASGSGKSSFLRAGLIARLQRDTERFLVLPTLRPGSAALTGPTGLQHSLGVAGELDGKLIAQHLAQLRARVVESLHQSSLPPDRAGETRPPTVVLPIDQAEELFVAGDNEAARVVELITECVGLDPNLLLLMTIRSDSFGLLQGHPRFSSVPRLPFDLAKLPAAAFKEVIEGPTRLPRSGITVAPELTEQLIRDFTEADALPLLAFTLERLVIDHGADGHLDVREYLEQMKGVGGAIRKAVEAAFAVAADHPDLPRTRAELDALAKRSFVPGLVRIDDVAAAPKRRIAPRSKLPPEALPLIDCLVEQRLLVADTDGTEPTVEVSHEAVLRHWRELADWIAAHRDDLVLSERITTAANDWYKATGSAKDEALVHRGDRLRTAEELLQWRDLGWNKDDYRNAYLAACREAERHAQAAEAAHRQRQRQLLKWNGGLVLTAALVTLIGAGLVINGQRNLGRAQSLMLARTAERFAESGDYLRAVRLSILAAHENALMPSTPEASMALASSAQGLRLTMEARGHTGPVLGARFSKDERLVLTWSEDGTARLWDVATGVPVRAPLRHDEPIRGAEFSKGDDRILTWSGDGKVRLWDATTGAQIGPSLVHLGSISSALFSRDERRILTSSTDGSAQIWDVASGAPVGSALKHNDWVSGAVFSRDERRILSWGEDGAARLWDAATGEEVTSPFEHRNKVSGAAFSNDERRILTWGWDRAARLWDANTGEALLFPLTHNRTVSGAIFSKNDRRILTWSADGSAKVWHTTSGAQIGSSLIHTDAVSGAVFSKNEDRILTWSADGTARLWSADTGAPDGPILKHEARVRGAVFSEDEGRILTWSDDGTARLWDSTNGRLFGVSLKHEGSILGARFSHDERRVLTWSDDGTARVWDVSYWVPVGPSLKKDDEPMSAVLSVKGRHILTGALEGTAQLWDATTAAPISLAFENNERLEGVAVVEGTGSFLTWSANNTVRLRNLTTGAQIGQPLVHDEPISGAVVSKDNRRILTWDQSGTAQLWDVAAGALVDPTAERHQSVIGAAFSKDARLVLTWSRDGTAQLWDANSAVPIGPTFTHDEAVSGATFSKNDHRILTWSEDGTARLWDVSNGEQLGQPFKHADPVSGAAFSHDELRIVTWSEDGTARLWAADTGTQLGSGFDHEAAVLGVLLSKDGDRLLTWSIGGRVRLWNVLTGAPVGPSFGHDAEVSGAALGKDARRILTWSHDGTARVWDAANGVQIGLPLEHDGGVLTAALSEDGDHILTWGYDGSARQWNTRWATRNDPDTDLIVDLCRNKLAGDSILERPYLEAPGVRIGLRNIDARDAMAAPILRGREGEDVCATRPTTWETVFSVLGMPWP